MRSLLFRVLTAAGAVVFIFVALAALLPPLTAVSLLFGSASSGPEQNLLPVARLFSALRFTVLQAFLSALLAVGVGLPAAFLTARRNFPGRRLLLSFSGVPLCVPPVVIALSFVLFYGRNGVINAFLMQVFSLKTPPLRFLYSLGGVVLAHGLYNFPVVLRTVSHAWERLPADREEAALLLGASPLRVFRTIVLPSLTGPVLSAALLVFLYCFFSFIVVLLFGKVGGTTLEVELYQAARNSLNLRGAALIALVETLCAAGFVFLYSYIQKHFIHNRGLNLVRPRLPLKKAREVIPGAAYLLMVLLFFAGPLLMIAVRSFSVSSGGQYASSVRPGFAGWIALFSSSSFLPALLSTVSVAFCTAVLSTGAALAFALFEERKKKPSVILRAMPFLPLAVSSVVLGFGWTVLIPQGSVWVLVVAQAAISWPFSWTQIRAALDRIPPVLPEAASLLSRRPADVPFRVLIPLARRGILSGAAFAFAISAGDATLPLVLSIPGFENLALLLYRLSGSYRFTEASACAVVLAFLTGLVFFLQEIKKERPS